MADFDNGFRIYILAANRLFKNTGRGTFADDGGFGKPILSTSAMWVDIDRDGHSTCSSATTAVGGGAGRVLQSDGKAKL